MIDLARVRADTPGVAHVAHLNNAGSALPPRQVVDATVDYLRREAEIGGYETAAERRDGWEHTYDALARLLNAGRDEIAVMENATRAWDMAFYAFPLAAGDRVLTGRPEYASNWIALKQVADRTGARIEVVPDDEQGQIDVAALERLLDDDVKLVSLVHVPTQSGLVNPAAEVGRLTRAAGCRCYWMRASRPASCRSTSRWQSTTRSTSVSTRSGCESRSWPAACGPRSASSNR
jgi:selenocysteine lyase/cysteine desulfurase